MIKPLQWKGTVDPMITIAIVEDEEAYAKQLTEYIEKYQRESGKSIRVIRFSDGDEIVEKYTGEYDIILMDIQMKFMDGMSAAEAIRKQDTKVVIMFITNMTNYAIRGYEVDAMDYVLKPVSYFAFSQKLDRAIKRIPHKAGNPVIVNTADGIVRTDASSIYYIESEGHNLIYHTTDGEIKERAKMQDAEEKFVPLGFFRSNKGYLVNLEYVDGVKDGCCMIKGETLLISRARRNDFMTALTQYMGEH